MPSTRVTRLVRKLVRAVEVNSAMNSVMNFAMNLAISAESKRARGGGGKESATQARAERKRDNEGNVTRTRALFSAIFRSR